METLVFETELKELKNSYIAKEKNTTAHSAANASIKKVVYGKTIQKPEIYRLYVEKVPLGVRHREAFVVNGVEYGRYQIPAIN